MKKPLLVSMFVLGLVSGGSAVAAQQRDDLAGLRARASHGAMQTSAGGNWLSNHVSINAMMNVDGSISNSTRVNATTGRLGTEGIFFAGGGSANTSSDLMLHNAQVRMEIQPNSWVNGVVEFTGGHDASALNVNNGVGNANVAVDEAFLTIGDLTKSAFYVSGGRQYVDFGYYDDVHALTSTLTQQLSQVSADTATLGYAQECGFHGDLYVFRGRPKAPAALTSAVVNNGGFDLGYDWGDGSGNNGYNLGVSWLRNLIDTPVILANNGGLASLYAQSVSGLSAHAAGYWNQWDAKFTWVSALATFNANNPAVLSTKRPSAWTVDLGYGFMGMGHENRLGVGYQASSGAANASGSLGIPHRRWVVDWDTQVWKSTKFEVQYTNDRDYALLSGGTGQNASTLKVRVQVGFL